MVTYAGKIWVIVKECEHSWGINDRIMLYVVKITYKIIVQCIKSLIHLSEVFHLSTT